MGMEIHSPHTVTPPGHDRRCASCTTGSIRLPSDSFPTSEPLSRVSRRLLFEAIERAEVPEEATAVMVELWNAPGDPFAAPASL